jgi:phosphate-selective porin
MKGLLTLTLLFVTVTIVYALPAIEIDDGKYLRITYETQFGLTYRDTGSGKKNTDNSYDLNFRRNRLGVLGTYNAWASFYFQTEYIEQRRINALNVDISDNGRNFYVLDAQIRLTPYEYFNVFLGKLKHNLTRENLEACFEPLTMDRSIFVYTPYKTSRDIGIAVWGNIADGIFQYRFDAMNGRTSSSADPSPSENLRYTLRANVSLLEPETSYGIAGTYLGERNVLTFGAAYQYEPKAVYGNVAAKDEAKDYSAYSFDVFFEYNTAVGAFTMSAAYLNISFDEAYRKADPALSSYGLNGEKNGYYVKAGYMIPKPVGSGKLQLFGRYDDFSFANLYNSSTNTDFFDQKANRMAFGLNYYIFGQDLKLTAEYYTVSFDKTDPFDSTYGDFSGAELFLQARF